MFASKMMCIIRYNPQSKCALALNISTPISHSTWNWKLLQQISHFQTSQFNKLSLLYTTRTSLSRSIQLFPINASKIAPSTSLLSNIRYFTTNGENNTKRKEGDDDDLGPLSEMTKPRTPQFNKSNPDRLKHFNPETGSYEKSLEDFELPEETIRQYEEEQLRSAWRHLFWIFPIIALLLCIWQIQRLEWKENLIAFRTAQLAEPTTDIPPPLLESTSGDENTIDMLEEKIANYEFRYYSLRGKYLTPSDYLQMSSSGDDQSTTDPESKKEIYFRLGLRSLERDSIITSSVSTHNPTGYHIIAPFLLTTGEVVFVNRGWIPMKYAYPSNPIIPNSATVNDSLTCSNEIITLKGLLRSPVKQGTYIPNNIADRNEWFWLDTKTMAAHLRTHFHLPTSIPISQLVFDLPRDDNQKDGQITFPIPGQTKIVLPNHHLNYAITWFSLSAFLSYFCFTISRGKRF